MLMIWFVCEKGRGYNSQHSNSININYKGKVNATALATLKHNDERKCENRNKYGTRQKKNTSISLRMNGTDSSEKETPDSI